MRMLWLLPKAAPVLLRHVAAYTELAALDLGRAQRQLAAQLIVVATMLVSLIFAAFFGCLALIVHVWDTPYRVGVIAGIAGGFLAVGVLSVIYRSRLGRRQSELFSTVRSAWREDRVIWERILAGEQEPVQRDWTPYDN